MTETPLTRAEQVAFMGDRPRIRAEALKRWKESPMTNANALPIQERLREHTVTGEPPTAIEREAADRIDALEKALRASDTALNDWLARYAGEFCDESHVKEADQRISDAGGTLAYIAAVTAENRAALGERE